MKRLAFLLLALSPAAALGQVTSDRSPRGCVAGPPEAVGPLLGRLPPQGTAICHYPPAEFHARIDQLLAVPAGRLGNAEVERIFSLPPLTVTHEDSSSTNLGIILHSAPTSAWWRGVIYVRETFSRPRFEGPPVPLRGLRRPVPIDPRERGDIVVQVIPQSSMNPPAPGPAPCLTVSALLDSARRSGWTQSPRPQPVPHNAAPGWRYKDLIRDGLSFSTGYSDEKECVGLFTLSREADPRPRS